MTRDERATIIRDMVSMIPEGTYTYQISGLIAAKYPTTTITLKLGVKVAFYLHHHQGIPVEMVAARGRGSAVLHAPGSWVKEVEGFPYAMDPCGSALVQGAIERALSAFLRAESPREAARLLGAEGRCCCCGADLTDPTSIARGIGPECVKKRHGAFFLMGSFA